MRVEIAGLCFTDAAGAAMHHNDWLVGLSFVIAAFGSYAALDMAERLRRADPRHAVLWQFGGAAALGGSIWSMHFVGMLAFQTVVPVTYDPVLTFLSLAIALGFVAFGLQIVRLGVLRRASLISAGAVVGLGVAAMHYTGMAAMRLTGEVGYAPLLWVLSIVIAMAAATAALWLALNVHALWQRVVAAVVMAVAIGGMHYTGMAATVITVDLLAPPVVGGMSGAPLATVVAGATFALLMMALIVAFFDRRLSAAAEREAAVLRAANVELEANQREIVRRLCSAGEFRDDDTAQHVARIADLSHRLALLAGCDRAFADRLREAAPLHDIGKIGVPDAVLLKRGRLTPQEWDEMRRHPEIGARILAGSGLPLLDLAAEIAMAHHERWDGTGYPNRLAGDAIPLSGRIVAVVDVFDALLSRRPYKEPWPIDAVVEHMRAQAGSHFDPRLAGVFLAHLREMMEIRDRFIDGPLMVWEPPAAALAATNQSAALLPRQDSRQRR